MVCALCFGSHVKYPDLKASSMNRLDMLKFHSCSIVEIQDFINKIRIFEFFFDR